MRRRIPVVFILAIVVAFGVWMLAGVRPTALRGFVAANDPGLSKMRYLADANHDYALSVPEMRKVITMLIRGSIAPPQDPNERQWYDIDGNGSVQRADMKRGIAIVRDLLTASCGNGTIDSGETCDDGVLGRRDQCSDVCQTNPIWWIEELNAAGPRDAMTFSETWNKPDGIVIHLPDGRKGLLWGESLYTGADRGIRWSIYDPATDVWTPIESVATAPGPVYELQGKGDSTHVLAAWVEKSYRTTTQNVTYETATLKARIYDIATATWGNTVTVWSAERDGSAIGMADGDYSKTLVLATNPLSILWADREQRFPEGPYYQLVFTESSYQGGVWSEAQEIGRDRAQYVEIYRTKIGEPVVSWGTMPIQGGCRNWTQSPRLTMRENGVWLTDPIQLPTNGYEGVTVTTDDQNRGVLTYIIHCETGTYEATNTLIARTYQNGLLGAPQTLEVVTTPNYSGYGQVSVTELGNAAFRVTWTSNVILDGVETEIWAPKTYTVTVP